MKRKSFETLLYSVGGVLVMAALLVAVNLIASGWACRADLTQDKIYTLSPGTRAILARLASPVTIRFYWTQNATPTAESVYMENFGREVSDLLDEYKQIAGDKIIIQKLDPEPDSDAADSARLDDIQPRTLSNGDKFYLGLAVSMLNAKQAVSLSPDRDRLLEYDISRAISRVMTPQKPVVGVMSALPVFGGQENPVMEEQGQPPPQPWAFINELSGDYTVRQVPLDTDKIASDINVLLVVHPAGITDKAQFAIDQFVLRGGKLIAFLDPLNVSASTGGNPMMNPSADQSASTLDKLLPAWGIKFTSGKVVADLNDEVQLAGPNGQPREAPAFLNVPGTSLNTNDVITSMLSDLWLPFAGAFTGKPAPGLAESVLASSTRDADLAGSFMAQYSGADMLKNFKSANREYALAIRLTGRFKSAFPNGQPGPGTNKNRAAFLKTSAAANTVILVGDADMLADGVALRQIDTPFGTLSMELNGNLSFLQNAVDLMAGSKDLIAIRGRGVEDRPFTVIHKMQAAAETIYQSKINDLQNSLQQTQQRLQDLQQAKSANQQYILSPQQQAQIAKFQAQEAQTQKDLKKVQRDLLHDVDALEARVTWLNIGAMPAFVTLFGISLAAWKRKRTAAK
ncbi:MAG: Gldg family protein [Verrucomicrobia bacterium]|nr:Gldg family protein [Verrucomicrobiota bacterium]MDE3098654.1 Gldg family protein [Verrucomicrobiota bacterium]